MMFRKGHGCGFYWKFVRSGCGFAGGSLRSGYLYRGNLEFAVNKVDYFVDRQGPERFLGVRMDFSRSLV